jgi:hypothetical protein
MPRNGCDIYQLSTRRPRERWSPQTNVTPRSAALVAAALAPIVLHLGDHDPSGLDMTRDGATVAVILVELVATCGRPTETIEIYEQVNRTT